MNVDVSHQQSAPASVPTKKKRRSALTHRDLDALAAALAPFIRERDVKIATLAARVSGLEQERSQDRQEIAALKHLVAKGATLAFRGPWKAGETYPRGTAIQHGGSLSIALGETAADAEPGASDTWQLAVRRGREGRCVCRPGAAAS